MQHRAQKLRDGGYNSHDQRSRTRGSFKLASSASRPASIRGPLLERYSLSPQNQPDKVEISLFNPCELWLKMSPDAKRHTEVSWLAKYDFRWLKSRNFGLALTPFSGHPVTAVSKAISTSATREESSKKLLGLIPTSLPRTLGRAMAIFCSTTPMCVSRRHDSWTNGCLFFS